MKKIIKKKKTVKNQEILIENTINYIFELGQRLEKRGNMIYTLDGKYLGHYKHDNNCPNCNNNLRKCWYYISQS